MTASLSAQDEERLAAVGISRAEAERQLALLASPPPAPDLVNACTLGDGIHQLDNERQEELRKRFERATADQRRIVRMVPASGAASRMFQSLVPWLPWAGDPRGCADEIDRLSRAGDPLADEARKFLAELPKLPFFGALGEAARSAGHDLEELDRTGDLGRLAELVLKSPGLGYLEQPKALIPFHAEETAGATGAIRTAFEEQLAEAAAIVRDSDDGGTTCHLHFTVPAGQVEAFESALATARGHIETRSGVELEVGFSIQDPSTDTLALAHDGQPARTSDGRLLRRPGGHGALLLNLDRLAAGGYEIAFIKNIDNVQPIGKRDETLHWKKILGGLLDELSSRRAALAQELDSGPDESVDEETDQNLDLDLYDRIADFLLSQFSLRPPPLSEPQRQAWLRNRLERPLRICGVVRNTGEPGGGPFWVRDRDGTVSGQIVEAAQIAPEDRHLLELASHFNPTDLVCGLANRHARPYALDRYSDPRAVFVAEKRHEGKQLRALERPGLWNGAMAGWNTVFVEVPSATFSPVKTVLDLARPAHQAD